MIDLFSERRMVENEVVFRQYNEIIQHGFDSLKEIASEEGQHHVADGRSMQLHFYCECADENCRKRIKMHLKEYEKIHTKRDQFIVLPDHQVLSIERVVDKKPTYCIVEKLLNPPESGDKLNETNVDNS